MDIFYGLEPRWWGWDRYYRFMVTNRWVAGAWVAGQFFDRRSMEQQLGLLVELPPFWVRSLENKRWRQEETASRIDPATEAFLRLDHRNFREDLTGLKEVVLNRHSSMYSACKDLGSVCLFFRQKNGEFSFSNRVPMQWDLCLKNGESR